MYRDWQRRPDERRGALALARQRQTAALAEEICAGIDIYKEVHGGYPSMDRPFPDAAENVFHYLSRDAYIPGLSPEGMRALQRRGAFAARGHARPVFVDGYGNPYVYDIVGQSASPRSIRARSLGPDGVADTPDDVLAPCTKGPGTVRVR